jgi:glycyl-tRNA synthetase
MINYPIQVVHFTSTIGEQNLTQDKYEKVIDLARRRGFFWPSFEIYGGVSGYLDLGPLGAKLKRRIEDEWLRLFVSRHASPRFQPP